MLIRKQMAWLLALGLFIAACSSTEDEPAAQETSGGASALVGEVETIDGPVLDLAEFQNQDLVLWFWAPW